MMVDLAYVLSTLCSCPTYARPATTKVFSQEISRPGKPAHRPAEGQRAGRVIGFEGGEVPAPGTSQPKRPPKSRPTGTGPGRRPPKSRMGGKPPPAASAAGCLSASTRRASACKRSWPRLGWEAAGSARS